MMTDTELTVDFYKACSNLIPNHTLEAVIEKNLVEAGLPDYTDADRAFAAEIQRSIANFSDPVAGLIAKAAAPEEKTMLSEHLGTAICDFFTPYHPSETAMPGSTDVGDVSWVCPTAQVNTACYAAGTPGHSWQLVAQGKAPLAHKAMLQAGKVLAGTVIDLLEDPALLDAAKREHAEAVGDGYRCPIPAGVKPRPMGAAR